MRKAYFQYYETFENIVQKFPTAEERDALRSKIINYGLFGTEPETLSDKEELVWVFIQDLIDDQVHRREVNQANRAGKKSKQEATTEKNSDTEPQQEAENTAEDFDYLPQQEIVMAPETETLKEKKKKFVKPTLEEVKEFCQERNNDLDVEYFYAYQEEHDWKPKGSKTPTKDWKFLVRTWEQNAKRWKPPAAADPDDKPAFL